MFCLETGALLLLYLSAIPVPESWSYRRTLWGCGFHNECDQTDQAGDSVPAQVPWHFYCHQKNVKLFDIFLWLRRWQRLGVKEIKQASLERTFNAKILPNGNFFPEQLRALAHSYYLVIVIVIAFVIAHSHYIVIVIVIVHSRYLVGILDILF